jgi:hypothetical protein
MTQDTRGHMHIYTFLLRMIDTMTSQNIDLSVYRVLSSDGGSSRQLRKPAYVCFRISELRRDSQMPPAFSAVSPQLSVARTTEWLNLISCTCH